MNRSISRRRFLGATGAASIGVGLAGLTARSAVAAQLANGAPHAEKLGWRLGCQAYSFRRFTFQEAVEKVQSLGLHYIEMYPGQTFSGETPDVRTNDSMSCETRKQVKESLADAGVSLVNYGVCGLPNNEEACRKTFEFAKDMGIETLVSEPPLDRKSTRLNSSHIPLSRMPSSA